MSERWNLTEAGNPPVGWEIIDDYVEDENENHMPGWVWI
jgi:hypothetical protein